jgi:hypothetical protein
VTQFAPQISRVFGLNRREYQLGFPLYPLTDRVIAPNAIEPECKWISTDRDEQRTPEIAVPPES